MTDQPSAQSAPQVACSCGVDGCRETGWPHEWDPVAAGDTCALSVGSRPVGMVIRDGRVVFRCVIDHLVTAPHVRWGSGYACAGCVGRRSGTYEE